MPFWVNLLRSHPANRVAFSAVWQIQHPFSSPSVALRRVCLFNGARSPFASAGVNSVSTSNQAEKDAVGLHLQSFRAKEADIPMSTAGSKSDCNASKREKIAHAAEQRLKKTTDVSHKKTTDVSATLGTTGSSSGNRAGKRKAPSTETDPTQQIGFSDSDDSDTEVKWVGVSSPGSRQLGKGNANELTEVAASGAVRKRGRRDQAHSASTTAAAAAAAAPSAGTKSRGEAGVAKDRESPRASKTFRIVSWNIDCLNPEYQYARVEEVCAIVLDPEARQLPDVILLQEVDAMMMSILNARLGSGNRYRAYPPRAPVENAYFTLVYVRVETVAVLSSGREDFSGSRMGRDLTKVSCTFNGKPLLIMTAHLESEKQSSDERKAQFNRALRELLAFREGLAIFAGDTNLREAEVKQEKLVKETADVWAVCGADPARRFTWDTQKNDNRVFDGGFKPRARYDRMFVNPLAKKGVRSFSLLGTERMAPPERCFPSDHFGIDACFEW